MSYFEYFFCLLHYRSIKKFLIAVFSDIFAHIHNLIYKIFLSKNRISWTPAQVTQESGAAHSSLERETSAQLTSEPTFALPLTGHQWTVFAGCLLTL